MQECMCTHVYVDVCTYNESLCISMYDQCVYAYECIAQFYIHTHFLSTIKILFTQD